MIYIHIPFCRSFCTYCDFYSELVGGCRSACGTSGQDRLVESFASALVSEISDRADEITDDVHTLYIGGGTPSVLPLSVFARVIETLRSVGHGPEYEEFTIEVNPDDIVEKGVSYVEGLMELGVNRISMGVQSFDDGILRWMNRRHDASAARRAYSILEEAGVENISIDLIFGLPQLSYRMWADTLKQALDISSKGCVPKHISSYQLSVEPGSALAHLVEAGRWKEASEDLCRIQYEMLCDALGDAGYNHYEISNFALPGFEARHNSAYWRHISYAGFGPGAHSFCYAPSSVIRKWNRDELAAYIEMPSGVTEYEELTCEQVVIEKIMLGLRTSDGIDEGFLCGHCESGAVGRALASGNLIRCGDGKVRIPENRFFISDAIVADLV